MVCKAAAVVVPFQRATLHDVEGFNIQKWHLQTGMGKHVVFFYFFISCFLAEKARRSVDVHVHRVYIEDTYVRSINMYEVSVLLLLYYNRQYLPRAVSSPKHVGWICMTTIKRYTYAFFAER